MLYAKIYIALALGFAAAHGCFQAREGPTFSGAMVRGLAFWSLALACLIEGAHLIALALALALAGAEGLLLARAPGLTAPAGLLWRGVYGVVFLAAGAGPGNNGAGLLLQGAAVAGTGLLLRRWWGSMQGVRAWGLAVAAGATLLAALALGLPPPLASAAAGAFLLLSADILRGWELFDARRDDPLRREAPAFALAAAFLGHALIAAPFLAPPA